MMNALVYTGEAKVPVSITEVDKPLPRTGEVLVRLKAAALNRRDYWITQGKYPGLVPGVILGSDGCGVVERVGSRDDIHWEGEEVIINPNVNWGSNPKVQGADFEVLGMPSNGTFAEYIVVNTSRLVHKPGHLSDEEAAALPLCGLTAYRSLFYHGQLNSNHKVLVTGIGGGVAQLAMLFSLAAGALVFVTSGDSSKLEAAVSQGASGGFNYREESWVKDAISQTGMVDLVIDSAGGESFNHYIRISKPAGRIIFYGSTSGQPPSLDVFRMFWKQITLQGSTMGNDQEFKEMVEFVNREKIIPKVDSVRPFNEILSCFERMGSSSQFGKLVVKF